MVATETKQHNNYYSVCEINLWINIWSMYHSQFNTVLATDILSWGQLKLLMIPVMNCPYVSQSVSVCVFVLSLLLEPLYQPNNRPT